ncbi:MAG: zinc ribbon domain-containing protein [Ruminococcaceae bacterium]|nr:zinc ribbon domain-containing protein [Oscillospiraceae bacterium]
MKKTFKCSMCGAEASARTKFCPACGGAVYPVEPEMTEGEYNDAPKKKIPVKLIAILAIALVVVILAVVLIVNLMPKKSMYVDVKAELNVDYVSEDDKTYFILGGKKLSVTMEGEARIAGTSLDGKVAIIKESGEDARIHLFKDNKLDEIAKNVASAQLSADGKAVVYITNDQTLHLYKIKDKSTTKIASSIIDVVISPNGGSLAYVSVEEDGTTKMTVWVDGKKTDYGKDLYPFGIANKGKLIYYVDGTKEAVYVTKGKDKEAVKLRSDVTSVSSARSSGAFNSDHTEFLFRDGDSFYVSANGKERAKVITGSMGQFGGGNFLSYASQTYNVKSFKKQYASFTKDGDTDLYYINKKWEAVKIAEDVTAFRVSKSGDVVYYLDKSDNLHRGKGYSDKFSEIAEDVEDFYINESGTECYFLDEDDTLQYVKKAGTPKTIADDVDDIEFTHDGYCLFVVDRDSSYKGTLYSSKNGSAKKKVAEDVKYVDTCVDGTYYVYADGDSSILYGTAKKLKFKKLMTYTDTAY